MSLLESKLSSELQKQALRWGGLMSILADLDQITNCVKRYVDDGDRDDKDYMSLAGALIIYRRCWKDGNDRKRRALLGADHVRGASAALQKMNKLAHKLADKWIAHFINEDFHELKIDVLVVDGIAMNLTFYRLC